MGVQDILTIRGILQRQLQFLEQHILEDREFITQLKAVAFLPPYAKRIKEQAEAIHQKIKNDLVLGITLSHKSEEKVKSGRISGQEIAKLFPYVRSFYQHLTWPRQDSILPFRNKSEVEFLTEIVSEMEKAGINENSLMIIRKRISKLESYGVDKQYRAIYGFEFNLEKKVVGAFHAKKGLISLFRPSIKEAIPIDEDHSVYLDIFFDLKLSRKIVASLLEDYINIMRRVIDFNVKSGSADIINRFKTSLEKRVVELEKKSVTTLEEEWLQELKQAVISLFQQNPSLFLTSRIHYQLKIMHDEHNPGNAYCDHRSLIDHYMVGLDVSGIILFYLFGKDFFQEITSDIFNWLSSTIPLVKNNKVIFPVTTPGYADSLQIAMGRLRDGMSPYRTHSIYTILAHETEHAFDRNYLFRQNRLWNVINYLIRSANLERIHNTVNVGAELQALGSFYLFCRSEAVTQLKEMIVRGRNGYKILAPLRVLKGKNILEFLEAILRELQRRYKEQNVVSDNFNISGFGYAFGHMMSLTIFLADCKKKSVKLIILDEFSMEKLKSKFPRAVPALGGYSDYITVEEGTPEWFLLESLREGTDERLREILKQNRIKTRSINDVDKLIDHNIPFYIFKPSIAIMGETLRKIEKCDDIMFFDLYQRSCDILGIKSTVLNPKAIQEFAEKLYEARAIVQREAGFHV